MLYCTCLILRTGGAMNYSELARKGFATAADVPEDKVTTEVHPTEKGSYRCRANLGYTVIEGTFTPLEEGDHGVVCIQMRRERFTWSYPHSWHHLWNILSENPETAPY